VIVAILVALAALMVIAVRCGRGGAAAHQIDLDH
jgi:hypothetical protein